MFIGLREQTFSRGCMCVMTGCGNWRSRRITFQKIPWGIPGFPPKMCTLIIWLQLNPPPEFRMTLIPFDRIHADLQVQSGEFHQHSRARAPTVINSAFIHNNCAIASNSEVDFDIRIKFFQVFAAHFCFVPELSFHPLQVFPSI